MFKHGVIDLQKIGGRIMSYEKYERSEMPTLRSSAPFLACAEFIGSIFPTVVWMTPIAFVGVASLWYEQDPGSAYALLAMATGWVYAIRCWMREGEARKYSTVREFLCFDWYILRGPLFWMLIVGTGMGCFYVSMGWKLLFAGAAVLEILLFFIHWKLSRSGCDELSMLMKDRLRS